MQKKGMWFYEDLPVVSSTNDAVVDLWQKVKTQCIVSAKEQTNGRGRLGRVWEAQAGNLFVSFAYEVLTQNIGHQVIISALAVFETIRFFAPFCDVKIKWPNDVFVEGKKISGILFEKGPENCWIMGVGVNVAQTPKVSNLLYEATSLADLNIKTSRSVVLEKLIEEFDKLQVKYKANGFSYIKGLWLDNCYLRAKKVVIKQNNTTTEGVLSDLDNNGSLILKTNEGLKTIFVGDLFKKDDK